MLLTKISYNYRVHYIQNWIAAIDYFIDEFEDELKTWHLIVYSFVVTGLVFLNIVTTPIAMAASLIIDVYKKISRRAYKDHIVELYKLSIFVRRKEYDKFFKYFDELEEG